MRGKRPHQGNKGRSQQPFFKKQKRSKKFWQQRQTVQFVPAPTADEDDHSSDDASDEGEPIQSSHDALLSIFSNSSNRESVGQEDESDDDGDDDESLESNDKEPVGQDDLMNDPKLNEEEEQEKYSDSNDSSGVEEEEDENEIGEPNENSSSEEEEDLMGIFPSDDNEDSDEEKIEGLTNDDPFSARVELEICPELKDKIDQKDFHKDQVVWSSIGRLMIQKPKTESLAEAAAKRGQSNIVKKQLALDEAEPDEDSDEHKMKLQKGQMKLINVPLSKPINKINEFHLKSQLSNNVPLLSVLQNELLTLMSSYKDVYFNEQSFQNLEQIRLVYVLHALNHMLKTRTKILKNNEKLAKKADAANVRDQGLVRPKILIVVPFKESARRVVNLMGKLLFGQFKGGCIANKQRFDQDFGTEIEVKNLKELKETGKKPDDYYDTFCGNTDDGFKLGLAVTKKTLKLYTDFYSSDIIIASPLGLRMTLGVEGELKRDHDFLASIEMTIFDQVDVFYQQNWEHILTVLDHLHLHPSKSHGVDFSRVRMWSLNGLAKYYRQTLMFSNCSLPEVNAIINKSCFNFTGSVRSVNPIEVGSIASVVTTATVPIVFHRFDTNSLAKSVDDRFEYFVSKVLPEYKQDAMYHTMVFLPSYFDFVRIRNYFQNSDLDFAEISEYTPDKKIAMARDMFFHGEKHFLLYSERAHFYKRFTIKSIRHLIFYQLPFNPKFFSEILNMMHASYQNKKVGRDGMSCTVIYNKYDVHRLSNVLSTQRAHKMLGAEKNVHMFSGN